MGLTLKISLLLPVLALASEQPTTPPVRQRHDLFYIPNYDNIETFVTSHPFIVFFFYHGNIEEQQNIYNTLKHLSEHFILAHGGTNVVFAEIDLHTDPEAALKLGIKSAPLVRLFNHGVQVPFRGVFNYEVAKRWIHKYADQRAIYIDEEGNTYHHEDAINCVLLRPNITDSDVEVLDQLAKEHHDVIFYYTDLPKFLDKEADVDHFRLVVRRHADGHSQSLRGAGPLSKETVEQFLVRAKLPDSVPFGAFESNRFFHRKVTTCFLFYKDADDPKLVAFKKVGRKFKTKLEFSHVNMTCPIGSRLAHVMGINPERTGIVKVIKFEGEEELKYRLKHWETQEELERFIQRYLKGTVQPYMKSEPVPVLNSGPIRKLVGKSVQRMVFDSPNDVLVYGTYVVNLTPTDLLIVEKVADRLEHAKHINLTIATFDAARNEHHGLKLKDFPVWAVYPRDRKNSPCIAGNMWEPELVLRFIETCLERKIRYPGEETPLNLDDSL